MADERWRRQALLQLTLLRFREFTREPEALFWGFAFPILLTLSLGVAFRNQPDQVLRVAAVTPELAAALGHEARLKSQMLPPDAAAEALRMGSVVLVAEPGAGRSVVFRYDDTNPEGRTARMLADRAVQMAAGRVDPVAASDTLTREPGSRYIDFLVPGIIGMGVMGNSMWGLGFSIVDARRRKLMKRIVATPMPRHYYLLSFLLWRLMLLVVEVGLPILFGVVAFGVPVRGSLLGLAILCLLGAVSLSALGLLVASRARTIEGVSGIMNLVMVPMWICSGVFFSSQRFPDAVQPLIKALPLTALIDALRANMLRGAGLTQLGPELAVLGAYLVICFSLALRLFRWR